MLRTLVALSIALTALSSAWASDDGVWFVNDQEVYAQGIGLTEGDQSQSSEYDKSQDAYEAATQSLDDRNWERAVDQFQKVIELGGRRVDASLYWLAYSLNKLNKRAEALDALAKLQSASFSASRWREDAKALEYQIREASGQPLRPEQAEDEELKLMIINSLIHTDPERAVPLLEKLLREDNSPQMKERALFVLAQSETERGYNIIADYARKGGDRNLQMKAIEYLGVFGDGHTGGILEDVYRTSTDNSIKRKILESFMVADENARLLSVARSEPDKGLRMKAIEQLGVNDETTALWELYQKETDRDVKEKLIEAFMISDASDYLEQVARSDDETDLRLKAVQQLGILDESDVLWELYEAETRIEVREAILNGLWLSDDVDHLIFVARKEPEVSLRKAAIERLGLVEGVRLRRETADLLGLSESARIEQALVVFYQTETDREIKQKLLDAMFIQDNVDGLIHVARTESDKSLRRAAIEKLSIMDSEEATDFLLELLED